MADDATKRKAVAEKVNWLHRPRVAYDEKQTEKQKAFFAAFVEFVGKHDGAAVVSAPGNRVVRVEYPEGLSLPIRLAELGYRLNFLSPGTPRH